MRRMRGRNEEDAVQLELPEGLAGYGQVGAVNGVEGTAENRDFQLRLLPARCDDVVNFAAMAQHRTSAAGVAREYRDRIHFPVDIRRSSY